MLKPAPMSAASRPKAMPVAFSTITGGIANSGTIALSEAAAPSVLPNGQRASFDSAIGIDAARGVSLSNGLSNTGLISVSLSGASVGAGLLPLTKIPIALAPRSR